MRIAFVVNLFPAISETFILRQITGLLKRGHEVDIFAYGDPADSTMHEDVDKYKLLERTCYLNTYASSPIKLVRLVKRIGLLITNFHKNPRAVLKSLNPLTFGKKAILLQVLNQIVPFLDKDPYNVIHSQYGPLGELGLLLRDTGVFRGNVVTSFRGYDISSYVRSYGDDIYDDLFKRGDLFLCVSEHIKEKLINLGCDEGKIVVHRSGVDTKKYQFRPRIVERDGRIRILTVARLSKKKGVEYGIHAVSKALQKCQRIEYKIVGDGPLRDKLQSLISELRAGDSIQLLGWRSQDEVAELLQKSDILLAPSVTTEEGDEEGIPGVIMEAFAQGLPVVTTRHAGIPEVVQDGESGFLVPERDMDGLSNRLSYLIERPELRVVMGCKGRKFVEEHYNIDRLNDRLVRLYRQLLDGKLVNTNTDLIYDNLSSELPTNQPSRPFSAQGLQRGKITIEKC